MNIIEKGINEIIPYEKNPRRNDKAVKYVANSIKEFGFKIPIVIDKDNVIVCGHTRLKAAKRLRMKTVPCIIADDLNEDQIKAFRLADNKVSEIADWDVNLLGEEIGELVNWDLSDFGFDFNETKDGAAKETVEDDFDVEKALKKEPKSKIGDIYQLGKHRLMCGDSTKQEDVSKLLNGAKCELTFTDPPYELITKGGGILKKANSMQQIENNSVDKFDPDCLEIYSDTNIYCHNKPLIKKYIELAEENKLPYDLCFYKKENIAPNYGGHLMTDCEYIAIIGRQSPASGFPKEMYSKCYVGKKDADNKLSYSKPIGLCAKFISLYAKENVLDLFGGSGSTLIACEQLDKKCFMMEKLPEFVDVIIDRWEAFTGEKAIKIS